MATNQTCYTTYVINDGSTTYANAYFEINYFNVYSTNGTGSVASGSGSSGASKTITAGVTGASASSAKTSGGGVPVAKWQGFGLGGIGAAIVGVVLGLGLVL